MSSFRLVARRLWQRGEGPAAGPCWLVQELPRRGLVAGLYALDPAVPGGIVERRPPRLYPDATALADHPQVAATALLPEDVGQLLAVAQASAALAPQAPWQPVLPLYPTSPVGEVG